MGSEIEFNMSIERNSAEQRYLQYFWMGVLKAQHYSINFMEITEDAREDVSGLLNSNDIKKINRYLDLPQISPYFVENMAENYWAVPSNITDSVSATLGKEWPAEDQIIRTCPGETIYVNGQILLAKALEKIKPSDEGISPLSGLEMFKRVPFEYLDTAKIYTIDMCYLDKIKIQDNKKFRKELKKIFDDSRSDKKYHQHINTICSVEKSEIVGYARNGLMLNDPKEDKTLIENLYLELKPERKTDFDSGKIIPLIGNSEDISNVERVVISDDSVKTEPISIKDDSLDYAIFSGIEWFMGDWKKGIEEAERTLKEKSRMIVSSYDPIALKIPLEDRWGITGNRKDWIRLEPPEIEDVVSYLQEFGFETTLESVPDHYRCIEAVR